MTTNRDTTNVTDVTDPAALADHFVRLAQVPAEEVYEKTAGYGFARRWVGGGDALNVCWDEVGYGTLALAGSAASVEGVTHSREACEIASKLYAAPNAVYRTGSLQTLPHADSAFDSVVALRVMENLEDPESFLAEIRRVLKPGGTLVISTPDRQVYSNERNRAKPGLPTGMYEPAFRELLESGFDRVGMRRLGAVAGGLVLGDAENTGNLDWRVEDFGANAGPFFGAGSPVGEILIAVCGGSGLATRDEGQPYLLLDGDRRVFDECEERAEDIELLRREIKRLQQTEVQAFQNLRSLDRSEISHLQARLERLEAENEKLEAANELSRTRARNLETTNEKLKERLWEMESSRIWRLSAPYRRLRSILGPR